MQNVPTTLHADNGLSGSRDGNVGNGSLLEGTPGDFGGRPHRDRQGSHSCGLCMARGLASLSIGVRSGGNRELVAGSKLRPTLTSSGPGIGSGMELTVWPITCAKTKLSNKRYVPFAAEVGLWLHTRGSVSSSSSSQAALPRQGRDSLRYLVNLAPFNIHLINSIHSPNPYLEFANIRTRDSSRLDIFLPAN